MEIAIVTSHLAHYRRHLYRLLDNHPLIEVIHYSGAPSRQGIHSLAPEEVRCLKPIKDLEFRGLHWQCGVLLMALKASHDAYIFTGDVKYISTWIASAILRGRGRKVYFWTIGWHRPEAGLKNLIRRRFYGLANSLLLYGQQERELAIQQGHPETKIDVVYNSVSSISDMDLKLDFSLKEKNTVGVIARLTPAKNLHLLIEAASLLNKQGHNIKVIFGGDGPEKARLQRRAEQLGVDCEFWGEVHDDVEINSFYRRVAVTVIPSAAGLTTIQSLSHGTPVISDDDINSQMPESSAILPGTTGSKYRARSVDSLAKEIQIWLDKVSVQPIEIANQCQAEVRQHWSPEVQASRMLRAVGDQKDTTITGPPPGSGELHP